MGEFSITHLLLLAAVFLIFFGPSRLPQLGQSLGKAIRGFKSGLTEIDVEAKDINDTVKETPKTADQLAQARAQEMNAQKVEADSQKKS